MPYYATSIMSNNGYTEIKYFLKTSNFSHSELAYTGLTFQLQKLQKYTKDLLEGIKNSQHSQNLRP